MGPTWHSSLSHFFLLRPLCSNARNTARQPDAPALAAAPSRATGPRRTSCYRPASSAMPSPLPLLYSPDCSSFTTRIAGPLRTSLEAYFSRGVRPFPVDTANVEIGLRGNFSSRLEDNSPGQRSPTRPIHAGKYSWMPKAGHVSPSRSLRSKVTSTVCAATIRSASMVSTV